MDLTKNRVILHCDMNGFFASVELLDYPELRDKPMAVCGDPVSRHGIILAKNEIAKRYGIVTAETLWQARKKCPDLQTVPPHHKKYQHYSRLINEIYLQYTDMVEPFSVDESWLDVTASQKLFGNGEQIADKIRNQVKKELGLTLSAGVSFNKIFAKMGSDYKKPDATTVITQENYKNILWPLDIRDLFFVGKATADKLQGIGIREELVAAGIVRAQLIDATPIGANVRSTVATYCGVLDDLRRAFARTDEAKAAGLKAGAFSYNTGKLRCPTCDGTGQVSLDVQFLPDVDVPCPDCRGRRYGAEADAITWNGHTLAQLMAMSIDEALDACASLKKAHAMLQTLHDLGLGYLTLGEATPALSGGEAQRLKLASEMGKARGRGAVRVRRTHHRPAPARRAHAAERVPAPGRARRHGGGDRA